MLPQEDRTILGTKSQFLRKNGLKKKEDEYSIEYYNNEIIIGISYERYSSNSRAFIRFKEKNEVFDIGWIMKVQTDKESADDRLEHAEKLLKYIEDNYTSLSQYNFCKEKDKLIEKYANEHAEEIYEKNKWFFDSLKWM